jgi:hypothetical protein
MEKVHLRPDFLLSQHRTSSSAPSFSTSTAPLPSRWPGLTSEPVDLGRDSITPRLHEHLKTAHFYEW